MQSKTSANLSFDICMQRAKTANMTHKWKYILIKSASRDKTCCECVTGYVVFQEDLRLSQFRLNPVLSINPRHTYCTSHCAFAWGFAILRAITKQLVVKRVHLQCKIVTACNIILPHFHVTVFFMVGLGFTECVMKLKREKENMSIRAATNYKFHHL